MMLPDGKSCWQHFAAGTGPYLMPWYRRVSRRTLWRIRMVGALRLFDLYWRWKTWPVAWRLAPVTRWFWLWQLADGHGPDTAPRSRRPSRAERARAQRLALLSVMPVTALWPWIMRRLPS